MGRHAASIELLPSQRRILERLGRMRTLERRLSERVHIVLGCAAGKTTVEVAADLGVDPQRVARWRKRFAAARDKLAAAANGSDETLDAAILEVLVDGERSGTPGKFTAKQLTDLIALACREPTELGLPVTHWTPRELAQQAMAQGIVESISPRHVARFFGGGRSASAPLSLLAQSQNRRSGGPRRRGRAGLRDLSTSP
jgi:putative transposase